MDPARALEFPPSSRPGSRATVKKGNGEYINKVSDSEVVGLTFGFGGRGHVSVTTLAAPFELCHPAFGKYLVDFYINSVAALYTWQDPPRAADNKHLGLQPLPGVSLDFYPSLIYITPYVTHLLI